MIQKSAFGPHESAANRFLDHARLYRAYGMIKSILDFPSTALSSIADAAWQKLPSSTTTAMKNFSENRSWLTRSFAKTCLSGGILAGAWWSGAGALGLAMAGAGACIVGRATKIDQVWTGQNLPKNPKEPLRETARKLVDIAARRESPQKIALPFENNVEPRRTVSAAEKAELMRQTDQALETFIQHATTAATIFFVHTNQLGLEINPDLLPKIVAEAAESDAKLWDVYIKHLGANLSTFQRIYACFWFFLSYSLGIIPNSIRVFMTNILKEGRSHLNQVSPIHPLESGINNFLDQMSGLLDAYNSATREYARTNSLQGNVDFYRRSAIERFNGKSLEQITQEFCSTLVDQFFPRIPFFESLKEYPIIGYLFSLLDFLFGGLINCLGRKILKSKLPRLAKTLIQTGIDTTKPTNLQFSIAITQAMTALFKDLAHTPFTPETPPFQPEQLPTVIEKLLETLDLTGSKDHPLDTQQKIREQVEFLDGDSFKHQLYRCKRLKERDGIRETMTDSGHAFIAHLANNTEQLFKSVFELLDTSFTATELPTEKDYQNAYEELSKTANEAIQQVIYDSVKGNSIEVQRQCYQDLYEKYKRATDERVRNLRHRLSQINPNNPPSQMMKRIDQCAKLLQKITSDTSGYKASLAGRSSIAGNSIETAFHESFYSFHKELPAFTKQLSLLQDQMKARKEDLLIASHLEQIDQMLQKVASDPELHFTSDLLRDLQSSCQEIQHKLPGGSIETIRGLIDRLETIYKAASVNQETMEKLARFAKNPKLYEKRLFSEELAFPIHHLSEKEGKVLRILWKKYKKDPSLNRDALDNALVKVWVKRHQRLAKLKGELPSVLAAMNEHLEPVRETSRANEEHYQQLLPLRLGKLQRKFEQIEIAHRSIQPSHVEKETLIWRLGATTAAKLVTPIAMDFFSKVYNFITKHDPYVATVECIMHATVNSYDHSKG